MCVAYDVDGVRHDEMPMTQTEFHHAKPIYEYLDGWWEDLSTCRTFADLPTNAQAYVKALEEMSGTRIWGVGVGPGSRGDARRPRRLTTGPPRATLRAVLEPRGRDRPAQRRLPGTAPGVIGSCTPRGRFYAGTFTATAEAAELCRAAHLRRRPGGRAGPLVQRRGARSEPGHRRRTCAGWRCSSTGPGTARRHRPARPDGAAVPGAHPRGLRVVHRGDGQDPKRMPLWLARNPAADPGAGSPTSGRRSTAPPRSFAEVTLLPDPRLRLARRRTTTCAGCATASSRSTPRTGRPDGELRRPRPAPRRDADPAGRAARCASTCGSPWPRATTTRTTRCRSGGRPRAQRRRRRGHRRGPGPRGRRRPRRLRPDPRRRRDRAVRRPDPALPAGGVLRSSIDERRST